MRRFRSFLEITFGCSFLLHLSVFAGADECRSHAPSRELPKPIPAKMAEGPKLFVDSTKGDDSQSGSEQAPWKTLAHALRHVRAGDTLYLRAGNYYESPSLSQSGTAEKPITIAAFPGELAIIDGGLREFFESPATSWEPYVPTGDDARAAVGEFVSTRQYTTAANRQVPHQFLPASWEPMWGMEDERPIALGHFGDSMIPLHGYRTVTDLRSDNEYWTGNKEEMRRRGIYCGPGLWLNRQTGRIHVRLVHHQLEGLNQHGYRGETDPRKIPLVVSAGFGDDVLRINGVSHVRLERLVIRGATGSPLIHVYGSENVSLEHITAYGGFPSLLINACKQLDVRHSVFRGLAAPWTSRAHMKYRGTASYQIILQNNQPLNENIEFANCEFTDDHDFAFLRFVKNLQFHHNFVDNFNDDGLECGPKLRAHTLFIFQNHIGRCLIPLTQHEIDRDESPLDQEEKSGVYVFRNVFDMRGGIYKAPPEKTDSTGSFLREEGHLIGDHGSPIWPVLKVYHNTFVRDTPVFRDSFMFGLGAQALRGTERDVFNNIFLQTNSFPGVGFIGLVTAERLREGGNILWGLEVRAAMPGDPFAKFRASKLHQDSKQSYRNGWTTDDRFVDPKLLQISADNSRPIDLRLKSDSPAINSGLEVSAEWPDPLRELDTGSPDIGAWPLGVDVSRIGVDGRILPGGGL